MAQSWCGRCCKFDCSQCSEQYSTPSVYTNGLNYDNYNQYQDQFGTYIGHNAPTLLDAFGGSDSVSGDLHVEPSYNPAASGGQYYPQFADGQTMFRDNIAPQGLTTEVRIPSELPSTYSVWAHTPSQPDGMQNPSISSVEWNDTTIDPFYASQHQAITDFGPLTQWDTQYPDYSQFPTSFSPIDNPVSPAQTTPSQEDLGSNYPPSYPEQYLLDIEQREGDSLSIHLRIPPSIPGALYFDNYLMAEFSQEADGTLNVRVHLPPGYANINSTFVHA